MMRPLRTRAPAPRPRRSGDATGPPCDTRGATAGDRSSCAACPERSCSCGGRRTSARPSAGASARPPRSACAPTGARVEAARVARHRDHAGLLLHRDDLSASASVSAIGISIFTCLPARMHCIGLLRVHLRRRREDRGFDAGLREASPRSIVQCGIPYFFATAAVDSGLPPTRLATSTSGMFCRPSRCFRPNAPWPTITIFMGIASCSIYRKGGRGRTRT